LIHAVCLCSAADVMGEILRFEADRRAINITINSLDTELRKVSLEHA
jgi:V-type H+-transporting ATPase subunit d